MENFMGSREKKSSRLRKVFCPCTQIWQSLAAGISHNESIRAGSSEACVALGAKRSPARRWFSLLCYQRILAMLSTSNFNQNFSGWNFLLPLWEMRGCLELGGEAEGAQILVFRGVISCRVPEGRTGLWWIFRWNPAVCWMGNLWAFDFKML